VSRRRPYAPVVASEAASLAGHLGLDDLCWIYDNNHITIEGNTRITFTEDVAARFSAYGWNVLRVADANDVDYIESKEADNGFFYRLGTLSTFGLFRSNVYSPPFVKRSTDARRARFGLEQNIRHSPINYLAALGSYDCTTEKTDTELRAVELLGTLLTTISGGGIVAQNANTAFHDGSSIFAGVFLPGLRSLLLNMPTINRRRANLVGQTLQEIIDVPAGSPVSTVVLLPRMGML